MEDLPGGLKQIDVIAKNSRVLSTRSAHEIKNKITSPDYIMLSGKNTTVIPGFIVQNPLLDIAREQKYRPERLVVDAIPGMGTVYVRWIATGKPPFNITIDSKKGGVVRTSIRK